MTVTEEMIHELIDELILHPAKASLLQLAERGAERPQLGDHTPAINGYTNHHLAVVIEMVATPPDASD